MNTLGLLVINPSRSFPLPAITENWSEFQVVTYKGTATTGKIAKVTFYILIFHNFV